MKTRKARVALGLAAGAALVVAAIAWASPTQISTGNYKIPVTAEFNMTPKVCDNRTSTIDLSGTLTFPGLAVRILFQNQDNNTTKGNGWHSGTVTSTAQMTIYDLNPDSIPKQPVNGGVGGNPRIWIELLDQATGQPLGDPVQVGRCVMGKSYQTGKYTNYLDGSASALLTALTCDQKGSFVHIDGDGAHGGLDANVYFTNNVKWTHASDPYDAKVSLGLTDPFDAKKGSDVNGGKVTGNPLISAQFLDHSGNPLTSYSTPTRCNQMGA